MQSTERWLPVVGYEGLYEVSDLGQVRSLDRQSPHRASRTGTYLVRGRMLSGVVSGSPQRVQVTLHRGGRQRTRLVHHLVLEAFIGPRGAGMECAHYDGDSRNNHLTNLRWTTHVDNEADKARHGTHNHTRKTACPRGHLLAEPNLVASEMRRGYRKCRACNLGRAYARKNGTPEFAARADLKYKQIMAAEDI